jgi:hypothetical protein
MERLHRGTTSIQAGPHEANRLARSKVKLAPLQEPVGRRLPHLSARAGALDGKFPDVAEERLQSRRYPKILPTTS